MSTLSMFRWAPEKPTVNVWNICSCFVQARENIFPKQNKILDFVCASNNIFSVCLFPPVIIFYLRKFANRVGNNALLSEMFKNMYHG